MNLRRGTPDQGRSQSTRVRDVIHAPLQPYEPPTKSRKILSRTSAERLGLLEQEWEFPYRLPECA